jgi:formyltetrahydrofolate synthetase
MLYRTDTQAEIDLVKRIAIENGAFDAVMADHWAKGKIKCIPRELCLHFFSLLTNRRKWSNRSGSCRRKSMFTKG